MSRVDPQDLSKMLLADQRVAGGIGLDQVRKILLKVLQHLRGGIVGIGDEAKVDDLFGFLIAHEIDEGRRM
jgi:hypothetical protein